MMIIYTRSRGVLFFNVWVPRTLLRTTLITFLNSLLKFWSKSSKILRSQCFFWKHLIIKKFNINPQWHNFFHVSEVRAIWKSLSPLHCVLRIKPCMLRIKPCKNFFPISLLTTFLNQHQTRSAGIPRTPTPFFLHSVFFGGNLMNIQTRNSLGWSFFHRFWWGRALLTWSL